MPNLAVIIQLNTPILISSSEPANLSKATTAHRLEATVIESTSAGFWVSVQRYQGERGQEIAVQNSEIFLPMHKIDHIFKIV